MVHPWFLYYLVLLLLLPPLLVLLWALKFALLQVVVLSAG